MKTSMPRLFFASLLGAFAAHYAPAVPFSRTVNAGDIYSKQQNDVTEGSIIINGSWVTPDKRTVANTKDENSAYGIIYVEVGEYSNAEGVENGLIDCGGDDVFKFSEFSQTPSLGDIIFELNNFGKINSYGNKARVVHASGITLGTVKMTNQSTGLIIGVDDAVKSSGQLLFDNKGTVFSATGQVVDLGSSNTSLESSVINSGTMYSNGNEAIAGGNRLRVQNSGHIYTAAAESSAIKMKPDTFGPGNSFTLINEMAGKIEGTKHGLSGSTNASITNSGTIDGSAGSAVNWDADALIPDAEVEITNTGTLSGFNNGIKTDQSTRISNSGMISATDGFAIKLNGSAANSITNSGMVTSQKGQAISLGSGGDTVVLQNGSVIEGEILGGAGHDIIRVDFGDGNTFGFSDKISGVEEISVESGKMAFLDGAELVVSVNADGTSGTAVGDIEFEAGAMLTLVATDFDPAEMLSGKSCRIFSSEVNFNGDIRIEGIAQTFAWTVINGVVTVGVPEPALCAALLGALALGLAARRRSGK